MLKKDAITIRIIVYVPFIVDSSRIDFFSFYRHEYPRKHLHTVNKVNVCVWLWHDMMSGTSYFD